MKKIIAMVLVIVLCCAVSVGLTVAYLTDRDSAANIFTVGNVAIDLTEDFEQGAMLIPGVNINKDPYITNVGNIDTWVWATVAIPAAFDNVDASQNIIHFNFDRAPEYAQNWVWLNNYAFVEKEINGIKYNEYTILYQTALKPGETTAFPFMTNVYLDVHVDIDPDGNWYHVENGNVTGPYWNSNTDPAPMLYVNAYGIQTNNFATVADGYNAYNAQWGDKGAEYPTVKIAAPESGAVRPAGYAPATEGETINNMVIIDKSDELTNLRALYKNNMTGDLVVKNSIFDGTYAMNVTAVETENAKLVCEDTTFMGWTSYSGWKTATFTNCTFQVNTNPECYNVIRPYDDTTFTGCDFIGTDLWLDNMGTSTINFVNCTFNGEALTWDILDSMTEYAATGTVLLNGAARP